MSCVRAVERCFDRRRFSLAAMFVGSLGLIGIIWFCIYGGYTSGCGVEWLMTCPNYIHGSFSCSVKSYTLAL